MERLIFQHIGRHIFELRHGHPYGSPHVGGIAHKIFPAIYHHMIARIIAREFHGRSYVVWIVKQHHIKAKERFHEIAIKYGTVLAIAFGIIEQLFGEERLFVAELLGVGGILKSILA